MEESREEWSEQEHLRQSKASKSLSPKKKKTKIVEKDLPPHVKYPRYLSHAEEKLVQLFKPSPSMLLEEATVDRRLAQRLKKAPAPEIVEFLDTPNLNSTVPIDEPLFQPYPLHLQFRDYEEFGECKQTLYFRNNDSVPRRMRLMALDSQHFSIQPNPRQSDRVAPGMEVSYEVTFKPHEKKDYHEKLVCVTDREKFIVEVSALGPWACMDFPDAVGFGSCPVNTNNEKTFLVRNIGERDTKFTLYTSGPFDVSPKTGFLKMRESIQVTVSFNAESCTEYDGELEVRYDNGQKSFVHLHGSAMNMNISIDKPIAELDPTYITLTSTCTIRIHNDSDIPVDFAWKAFANRDDEEEERARLVQELDRLESLEYDQLLNRSYDTDVPESLEDEEENPDEQGLLADSSEVSSDDVRAKARMSLAEKRDRAAIHQKFKSLRRAVEEDPMLFADEAFQIEPMTGQVWSHSSKEVTITFKPNIAADFGAIVSLAVSGREHRLPLKLLGQGVGPKAAFTFHIVDVGNVFVNSSHVFELQLENRGDIECAYSLDESDSPIAKYITFTPSSGVLGVEQVQPMSVGFRCGILGEFSELFTFSLKGSNEKLKVRLKGSVIGPTFHLNIQELKFDRVAYGFTNTRTFNIYNTSAIPMEFALRVPGDGKFDEPEFFLEPSRGYISPGQHQAIKLEFTSRTVIKYNMQLVVDVIGIGQNILEVPIRAECAVPNVLLLPTHVKRSGGKSLIDNLLGDDSSVEGGDDADKLYESDDDAAFGSFDDDDDQSQSAGRRGSIGGEELTLNFGKCFLRHPYVMDLTLRNTSDVRAFFEVVKQDETTQCIGTYHPEVFEGSIEPMSEINVPIELECAKLGKLTLPVYVRVLGSDKPPLMIDILALCRGPRVIIEPTVLDFGLTQCLQDTRKTFTMENRSLIHAAYKAFVKNQKSRFHLEHYEGCLGPGESIDFEVTVNPNDTTQLRDELHLFVTDGEDLVLPLQAKGKGTTMFCQERDDLEDCRYGNVFTSRTHEKKFLLENRGRREQALTWINQTIVQKQLERNKLITEVERMMRDKDPAVQKKAAKIRIPPEPKATFSVYPETVLLRPKTGCMFSLRAESEDVGEFLEELLLESKVGKDKKPITVVKSSLSASFINPLLEASTNLIQFCYTFDPKTESTETTTIQAIQRSPFKLKNISKLPLDFILRTQEPFSVDTWEIYLEQDEEVTVNVMFDPFFNDELNSQTVRGKLVAVHKNHPQKDVFDIEGQINFPNLAFNAKEIDFGCVMNETTKSIKCKMTNSSIVETTFSWVFTEEDDDIGRRSRQSESSNVSTNRPPKLSPTEVFDIRPTCGVLQPGESLDVEISFFGHPGRRFQCSAICEVKGGPEYELQLRGEASQVAYRLDQTSMDFGDMIHDRTEEQHFTISNTSKVPFAFRAISSRSDIVSCTPSEGNIPAKGSEKITVRFSPGVPELVQKDILLEIAHFEPIPFRVSGRGIYASVALNLPRAEDVLLNSELPPPPASPDETSDLDGSNNVALLQSIVSIEDAHEWAGILAKARQNLEIPSLPTDQELAEADEEEEKKSADPRPVSAAAVLDSENVSESKESEGDEGKESEDSTQQDKERVPRTAPAVLIEEPLQTKTPKSPKRAGRATKGTKFDMRKVRVESEANRLRFVRFLKQIQNTEETTSHAKKAHFFSIARYVVDFGNVVVGKTKKKPFRLLNTSGMSFGFEINKAMMLGTSFSIDPGRVARLNEKESVELNVQFTAKKDAALGPVSLRVPIDIRNGPPVELLLLANVTIPDVSCSSELLSFDDVIVGHSRVSYVQLKNVSPVPVEWNLLINRTAEKNSSSIARGGKELKNDGKCFSCFPSAGSLAPNERVNVEVSFAPDQGKNYMTKLTFRIANNPKAKVLVCKGSAKESTISFSEQVLCMKPTLPSLEESAFCDVLLSNDTDRPLEVYSVDFDTDYLKEAEIINTVLAKSVQTTNGTIFANPRAAGEPLQQSIIDMYNEIKAREAAELLAEEQDRLAQGEEAEDGAEAGVGELEPVADSAGAPLELEKASAHPTSLHSEPSYRERGLAIDVIVHGAPLSGKTRTAEKVKAIAGDAKIIFLDDIIRWGVAEGLVSKEFAEAHGLEHPELVAAADTKKKKAPKKPVALSEEELVVVLGRRISEKDLGAGLILDGLSSSLSPNTLLNARAVKKVLLDDQSTAETRNKLHFILVDWERHVYDSAVAASEVSVRKEEVEEFFKTVQELKNVFPEQNQVHVVEPVDGDDLAKEDVPEDEQKETEDNDDVEQQHSFLEVLRLKEPENLDAEALEKTLTGWLPEPGTPRPSDWDEFYIPIPASKTFELIKERFRRAQRRELRQFSIETVLQEEVQKEVDGQVQEEVLEKVETGRTRWVIPAQSNVRLRIRFSSEEQGTFEEQLLFEVLGSERQYYIIAKGTCTVPTISTDPRNVFMNRVKTRSEHKLVSKKYVMAFNTYEFGPLLVGRKKPEEGASNAELLRKKHCEVFRMSNSGILPVEHLSLSFVPKDVPTSGDFGAEGDLATIPFLVEPNELRLDPGETKDVFVWALPQTPGEYNAKLMCCIKDNPVVAEFNVSCVGSSPTLQVTGPWDDVSADGLADQVEPPAETPKAKDAKKAPAKSGKVPPSADNDAGNREVNFDRLLLGRQDEKMFSIKNTSKVPVQWNLLLQEFQELEAFRFFPQNGVLNPSESASVSISFTATEPKVFEHTFAVTYQDTEAQEESGSPLKIPIRVKAEGYHINVSPSFLQEGEAHGEDTGVLDFGTLRVFEERKRTLSITNTGKYPVEYKFNIRKRLLRELISMDPKEGRLEAGEKGTFTFVFLSQDAVSLRKNKDIQCVIMEPKTGKVEESFEVPVSACSVFSSFKIQPSKGIHFGAVKFDSSPVKTFEVKNDGDFVFSFEILTETELEKRTEEFLAKFQETSSEKGDSRIRALRELALPRENLTAGQVQANAFTLEPRSGLIQPDQSLTVNVKFSAESDKRALEKLHILISGRDPSTAFASTGSMLQTVPFELSGESHVPGINTANYQSIFEEQGLVRRLDPDCKDTGVFATEEKIFSFGPVIHTTAPPNGICERFKISNPNKIKAVVNLEIVHHTDATKGVFSVQPTHLELPSHEYDFVNVYFKPTSMKRYSATFKATVEDGQSKPETYLLQFDIQGQGTLPCLTVIEPADLSETAKFVVDFGRTELKRSKTKEIRIRNDGIVPATVRFDMPTHDAFDFPLKGASVTIGCKEVYTGNVTFHPSDFGEQSCELLIRVLHNEFELSRFELRGEGFQELVGFEDLPEGQEDTLHFGDIPLLLQEKEEDAEGSEEKEGKAQHFGAKSVRFVLKNNGQEPVRFEWDTESLPGVSISPAAGHLAPFGKMEIEATLSASEPMSLNSESSLAAKISVAKIKYSEEAFSHAKGSSLEWHSNMANNREDGQVDLEPAHEVLEDSKNELLLPCFGEVDFVRYELVGGDDSTTISFKPTMMFQSRAYKFHLKNPGHTALRLAWSVAPLQPSKENSHCPFTIIPAQALISAGSEEVFTVRFAPLEVEPFAYEGIATIDSLAWDMKPLRLCLQGATKRPVCHFELESSTYLERRKGPLPVDIIGENTAVKVLEFESLGVRVKNTKRFHVINPMNVPYEFELTALGEANLRFKCTTQRGVILPGKRAELVFTFTADGVETQESFWQFNIREQNVSQTLLLVGTVSEPRVELEKKHVNFHSVLVGGQSDETVYLVNHESIPFSFSFDANSFVNLETDLGVEGGDGRRKPLRVEPMAGTVAPNSRLPLVVRFAPQSEKSHNFNLMCVVHRKPDRLSLNVKGEGSAIHDRVVLVQEAEDGTTRDVILASGERAMNEVSFGDVQINDKAERIVAIHNGGKFHFDFMVSPPQGVEYDPSVLSISTLRGTVPPGESVQVKLSFSPKREVVLESLRFVFTVAGSLKYNLNVRGRGLKPSVTFSSMRLDFGPCFVPERGVPPATIEQVLTISNDEVDTQLSVDCLFEKTNFLDVESEARILQPGESMEVPVRFTPRNAQLYAASIPFEINGLYVVNILFNGEGTPCRVELENMEESIVSLGTLCVYQKSVKKVSIINRSKRAASFSLTDENGSLAERAIFFSPSIGSTVTLKAREACTVSVFFSPEKRLSQFNEPVFLNVNGTRKKLLTLTGSCQAEDVKIELNTLTFGHVVEGCTLTKKIQVENNGDLSARFRFEKVDKSREFTIFPMDGVIPAHSQVMVDVTFEPLATLEEIRGEFRMVVDGTEQTISPLSLVGACIPQPEEGVHQVDFESKVRGTVSKTVQISNKTKTPWILRPTMNGNFFSGPERLEIAAGGTSTYEISYRPLSMTNEDAHQGSVFFALPDGNALLYRLSGKAVEPDVEGSQEVSVPAKKSTVVMLTLKNWARVSQRFAVKIERVEGNASHFFTGTGTIDVPKNAERNFKLNVVGYIEGKSKAKVTFTNEQTGEYVFFFVQATVTAPESQGSLVLETTVRQSGTQVLTIENPFFGSETKVSMGQPSSKDWWSCTSPMVRVKALNDFAASREGQFEVEYRPLLPVDEEKATLVLKCPELGSYTYALSLKATPPQTERSLHFGATLGGSDEQVFRFTNFVGKAVEYSCSVGQPLFFQVAKTTKAGPSTTWEGVEQTVVIRFEPQALGEVRDVLTVKSPEGGEYTCVLYGRCDPPRPQGPFKIIDAAKGVPIEFKNVFDHPKEFKFIVDSGDFSVNGARTQVIKVDAAKTVTVTVKSTGTMSTGKLLVSCEGVPDLPPWTYYLKGPEK